MIHFAGLLLPLFLACTKTKEPVPPPATDPCVVNGVDTCVLNTSLNATINLSTEYQAIHSFGASDCWGIKFVGKNWPVAKKDQIADLLFSKDFDANGNPKGIGLSMWRINAGAGSYEQGEASKISSEWRREEGFLNAAGSYDWSKQAGNRWFAEAAKKRGVENLLLFSIAPPVSLSKNGLAIGPGGADLGKLNLQADKYPQFAEFMAEVAKHYNDAGLPINYISPLNEPQWDWQAGSNGQASQEGTAATNAEAFEVVKELDSKLISKGVSSKIAFGESAQHNYIYGPVPSNAGRSDQINYFWNSSSAGYLGNFSKVEKVISSHSYFSQPDVNSLVSNRLAITNRLSAISSSVKFWQTEYCILSSEDNIVGNGRDLGINTALYIARIIHTDLALANASAWHWWLGVSPSDYKDGLVYIADNNGQMGELPATKNDGTIYRSKMLWALGNYSRFIRPGMIRVGASLQNNTDPNTAATNLMISAYKNPTTKELVTVVINMTTADKKINFSGASFSGNSLKTYTTSDTNELKYSPTVADSKIVIPARSVVTFVGTYQ
jgi:O-glycosyl hydrolase